MAVTYKRGGGKEFASIKIDGDDAFVALVTGALNKIYEYEGKDAPEQQSLRPGKKMIKAINESGNVLTIRRGGSFTCTGSGDEQFVKFRNLIFKLAQQPAARTEFARALKKSGFIDTAHFAKVLANSNVPVTERAFFADQLVGKTVAKVAALLPGKSSAMLTPGSATLASGRAKDTGKKAIAARTSNEKEWQDLLDNWLAGLCDFKPHALALDTILRLLEPGFADASGRSKGVNATVIFAPDSRDATCQWDKEAVRRPRTIAFAHELIHAYYMTTGSRLYKESSTLDELLTAGLPPFHYREITENRFRVLKSATTPVRQYYKVGVVAQMTVCAHCGKEQPVMARGGAKATKCEACGKSLPYDDV